MEFYKNIKIVKVSEDTFEMTVKINEMFSQTIKLKSDQLEHIINCYRKIK